MRRALVTAPLLVLASLAAPASATPSGGVSDDPTVTGGAVYGEPTVSDREQARERRAERRRRRARRERTGAPTLESFELSRSRFFLHGSPVVVKFRIADRSKTVKVALDVMVAGKRDALKRIDLGDRATGAEHAVRLTGYEEGGLPHGEFELRLRARDPGGRSLRQGARASRVAKLALYGHRFPLLGSTYTYGAEGSRFGAAREGHTHQGQDLSAPEGTPVVAPRGGVVKHVEYQEGGAGWYVILDGAGEDRDYAFMHLRTDSIRVKEGQRVRTGQRLADVGNTGGSSGAHLHFEIWEGGGWYTGGDPVDPYPYLKRWDSWS